MSIRGTSESFTAANLASDAANPVVSGSCSTLNQRLRDGIQSVVTGDLETVLSLSISAYFASIKDLIAF